MDKKYEKEMLFDEIMRQFVKKEKPMRVEKLYELMGAVRQVDRMRIDNDLDDLETKRRVRVKVVRYVEVRFDTIAAEKKIEEIRAGRKNPDFAPEPKVTSGEENGREA